MDDRSGVKLLHLLCHDADIGLVTAVVAEAVKAKTVIEIAEQDDIVLQADVGTPSAATTASAASATSMAATATNGSVTAAAAARMPPLARA